MLRSAANGALDPCRLSTLGAVSRSEQAKGATIQSMTTACTGIINHRRSCVLFVKPAPHTENDCILFSGSSLTNCLRFRRRHLRIICHQPSTTRDSPRFIIIRQRQFCVGCCLNVKPRPSRFRPRYLPPITNEKVRRARVFPIGTIRTVPLAITRWYQGRSVVTRTFLSAPRSRPVSLRRSLASTSGRKFPAQNTDGRLGSKRRVSSFLLLL